MNFHADKTRDNKSHSAASEVSQQQSGTESAFQFEDKRPEAIVQKKLQEMANSSPKLKQLRGFQEMANKSSRSESDLIGTKALQMQPPADTTKGANHETEAFAERDEQMRNRRPQAVETPAGTLGSPLPPPAISSGSVVQAKMGFEIELNGAPVYGEPPASRQPQFLKTDQQLTNQESGDIKKYLGGGLEYGTSYGTERSGLFDLSADHDAPSSNPHHALMNALAYEGYIDPLMPYATMSNIEYRTPPIEERDPGATALVARIGQAVEQHVSDTANKAQQTDGAYPLINPALSIYTGIPKVALLRLTSNSTSHELSNAIDTAASVNPKTSFQTTTGILPSEIPQLFADALQKYTVGTQNKFGLQAGQIPQVAAIKEVLTQSAVIAESVLGTANFLHLDGSNRAALKGWLTLITQYLFGHYLEQTEFNISTPKNLVLYFSKTDIHSTIAALPPTVRPPANDQDINWNHWHALLNRLHVEVQAYDIVRQSGLTIDHDFSQPAIVENPDNWIRAVLSGEPTPGEKSSNPLNLDVQTNSPNSRLRTQEEAIPLEERLMENRMTDDERHPGNIAQVITTEWQQAVNRRQNSTESPGEVPANRQPTPVERFLLARAAARRWIEKARNRAINVAAFDQTFDQNHGQAGEQALVLLQDIAPFATQLEALLQQVIDTVNQHQQQQNQQIPPRELMNVAGGVEIEYTNDDNYEPQLYPENNTFYVSCRGHFFEVIEQNQVYGFEHNNKSWQVLKRKHLGQVQTLVGLPDTWQ